MAGYLEYLMNPATQGLLNMSAGLLQAGGPSPYPTSFGQALGRGVQQGYAGLASAQQAQQQQALVQLEQAKMGMVQQQLKQAQAQFEMQQGILRNAGLLGGGSQQQAPTQIADASAGPTTPGMSANTSQLAFGTPSYATAPQQPQASPNQAFPFNLQQLTAMKLAGMPDLLPNYKETQPDLKIEGGIIRDMKTGRVIGTQPIITPNGQAILPNVGPDGSYSVSGVPGADALLRNQKRIEGEEGARYQYEPTTDASGRVIPRSKLTGEPIGSQGAPSAAPTPMQPRPMSGPWSTVPLLPKPMGMGQTTYQKNLDETRSKYAGTLSEKYGAAAEGADQRIALNNQALDLVDKADTGPGAVATAEVKSWLVKLGIPEGDFEKGPSATTALNKDLLNAATQRAKQVYGARMTQQEVMLMLQKGSPNTDMQKAAIKFLINADNAQAQYQKQQGSDLGRYLGMGGDPHQFEAWYARSFPLSKSLETVKLDTGKRPPLSSFGSK